jgi:hypothetical protein
MDRLPEWKSWFMCRAGRTLLAKFTLSAIRIHVSIVIAVSPWIHHVIDKVQKTFIDLDQGRSCLMEVVSQDTIGFLQHPYTSS